MDSGRIVASGIPAETYRDPARFEQEQERVFRRHWGFACLDREVESHGAYTVATVGGDRVVVVRDGETLRAFHNVCQHRGAEVAAGTGTASAFRCPYHAWTYGLDGGLVKAPGVAGRPGAIRLRALRLESWGPFVFVCSDPAVAPLRRHYGELFDDLDARVGLSGLADSGTTDEVCFETEANWKVIVENSLECYHCAFAHPGLAGSLDLRRYRQWTGTWWSTQQAPQRIAESTEDAALGEATRRGAEESGLRAARFNFLFPNLFVSVWPGSEGFSTTEILPLGFHRTRTRFRRFFNRRVPDAEREESLAFIRQVIGEDVALCESVQRGLDRGVSSLRLVVGRGSHGADERCIAHFHACLREALQWPAPAPIEVCA